jgi:hypothetical protein
MEEQTKDSERFRDFLNRKNIDAEALVAGEPSVFRKWAELFAQVHEESFVMQQKFLLNPIRRKYPKTRFPSN